VVGIATDYCVHATAADAARAGFATRVLLDLTAGVAPESTAKAIEDLRADGVELTPISMQRIVPLLRLAELEAEAPVLPPGDGGVGAQVGLAQDG